MTLAHQTQKVTREAAASDLVGNIIASNPKKFTSSKKEKEDDGNSERNQKREKDIMEQIVRFLKSPLLNEYKEYKYKEQ